MTLKKLTNDHYIIVDDSEIKINDWVYSMDGVHQYFGLILNTEPLPKKIIYSTQPLEQGYGCEIKEGLMLRNVGKELCYDLIKPLSLSEVKELIGEVDVEKMIEVEFNKFQKENPIIPNSYFNPFKLGVLKGYNQALEDNKDKKYTIDDMIKCWKYASIDQHQVFGDQIGDHYISFIKSLQPKQEWEVEFVDGKLKLK